VVGWRSWACSSTNASRLGRRRPALFPLPRRLRRCSPRERAGYQQIQEAQAVALWRRNAFQGNNDLVLEKVLDHLEHGLGVSTDNLLRRIRGIAADGRVIGSDELDLEPLGQPDGR
jgi:hypothetical protein